MNSVAKSIENVPVTVALSSGFFGFFAHCGFVKGLGKLGIKPSKITGSSAGALVGGLWAAGADMNVVGERLSELSRKDFWDPGFGMGLLKGKKFNSLLEDILPVNKVEECETPLALSVWNVKTRRTEVITSGSLSETIRASCAVPFMFQPVKIDNQYYLDGGIRDRPAVASCDDSETVLYHHLKPRSFYRKFEADDCMPNLKNMVAVQLGDFPRLSPFNLSESSAVIDEAFDRTLTFLGSTPISEDDLN